jgi:PAS domain S-box-containing protein
VVASLGGQPMTVLQHSFLIADENGKPARLASVLTDITERKRAEAEIEESRRKYQALIETTSDFIWEMDALGRYTYCSPQMEKLWGIKPANMIGKTPFDVMPADQRDNAAEFFASLVRSPRSFSGLESAAYDASGCLIQIDTSGVPFFDENGNLLGFRGISRDITERKRAEEALAKEQNNLRHLLQSSDHERQLIAYDIHDGLAQQLAGAIMQFQVFDHLRDQNPTEALKAYEGGVTLLRQGHFEARRLIAGVRPPVLDEEGVSEAIAHLVHEQSHSSKAKITFSSRVDFDRLAPTLENAIYRIAQEGLANACRHSKSEKVRVGLVQHEDQVRIEVQDWGVGFDTAAVPKNRFGLEGIRQRARLLGGKCSIRSTAGKGTRITVELPVVLRD